MGCCARDQPCDRCLADALAQLRGVAACRGEFWARAVAARVSRECPWPPFAGRCAVIARRKVRDLADDERLRERLARIAVDCAARWWSSRER